MSIVQTSPTASSVVTSITHAIVTIHECIHCETRRKGIGCRLCGRHVCFRCYEQVLSFSPIKGDPSIKAVDMPDNQYCAECYAQLFLPDVLARREESARLWALHFGTNAPTHYCDASCPYFIAALESHLANVQNAVQAAQADLAKAQEKVAYWEQQTIQAAMSVEMGKATVAVSQVSPEHTAYWHPKTIVGNR